MRAERAIDDLQAAGFGGDQIGVAMRDRTAQGQLIEETGVAEGAVTGAVGGGLLGGLAGFLASVGTLAIPGVGPVVAGGILASTLGTAAAGAGVGAVAGGLLGGLTDLGFPEEEARYFETEFREGGVLVTVKAGTRAAEAAQILERNGGNTGITDPAVTGATAATASTMAGTAVRSSALASRDFTGWRSAAALFENRASAERAIRDLQAAGFSGDRIGVALRDRTEQGALIEDTGTKAAEGAVTGAVGGGLLGALAGFLIGIGALVIPGIGPVVAGGVLASALGTAGATAVAGAGVGAVAGGLVGALAGLGIPEEEARYFETGFREGRVLVTVDAGYRMMEAMEILERNGGDTGASPVATATRTAAGDGKRTTGRM
jgi:hypothetical protein